jgi:hypothetical protein
LFPALHHHHFWVRIMHAALCAASTEAYTAASAIGAQAVMGSPQLAMGRLTDDVMKQTVQPAMFVFQPQFFPLQNTNSLCPAAPYSTVCYTQKGLAWYSEWGTLRNTNNAIFLATLMGKHGASPASRQQHICWARR